jgi:hypothetical protein
VREYSSKKITEWISKLDEKITSHILEHNSVTKQKNHSLLKSAKCILLQSSLSAKF